MMEPNAKCECGADVIEAINCTFPGMGTVLNPEPHPAGSFHVGTFHSGQRFARRHTSDDGDGPRWVAHKATCPLPQPRRAPTMNPNEPSAGRTCCAPDDPDCTGRCREAQP